jgi:hypothetical protein
MLDQSFGIVRLIRAWVRAYCAFECLCASGCAILCASGIVSFFRIYTHQLNDAWLDASFLPKFSWQLFIVPAPPGGALSNQLHTPCGSHS